MYVWCTDGPKFIDCEGLSEGRRLYEKDVRVVCDIQSQPAVHSVSVHWTASPATSHQQVNLTVGQRQGHLVLLESPATSHQQVNLTVGQRQGHLVLLESPGTSHQQVNLTVGQRQGHLVLLLQPSNTSVRTALSLFSSDSLQSCNSRSLCAVQITVGYCIIVLL